MEGLAKLRPAFGKNGTVTAGNASGINDAGAALVVSSGQFAEQHGLRPLGRLVSWAVVGVEPEVLKLNVPAPVGRPGLLPAGN